MDKLNVLLVLISLTVSEILCAAYPEQEILTDSRRREGLKYQRINRSRQQPAFGAEFDHVNTSDRIQFANINQNRIYQTQRTKSSVRNPPQKNFETFQTLDRSAGCPLPPNPCSQSPTQKCKIVTNSQGCLICRCKQQSNLKVSSQISSTCPDVPEACIEDPGERCSFETDNRGCRFCKCTPKIHRHLRLSSLTLDKILQGECPKITRKCKDFGNTNCTAKLNAQGCLKCRCSEQVEAARLVACSTVICSSDCGVVEGSDGCSRCSCPDLPNEGVKGVKGKSASSAPKKSTANRGIIEP